MKWYKKLHREIKKVWDEELRPLVEPVLRIIVKQKVEKEIGKHVDK